LIGKRAKTEEWAGSTYVMKKGLMDWTAG
jgi:hypothetical protein